MISSSADLLMQVMYSYSKSEDILFVPLNQVDNISMWDEIAALEKAIRDSMPASDERLTQILEEQSKDSEIDKLKQYVVNGWPDKCSLLEKDIVPYWCVKEELSMYNGMLMKGHCMVIPRSLRKEILNKIHEGHQGITKCRRRASDSVYWPGLSDQIQQLVTNCPECIELRQNNREPLLPSPVPNNAWERVGIDIAEINKKQYLVMVDYYSSYIEVLRLNSMRSSEIIDKCKVVFARFGIPLEVRSDNGPCFASNEFLTFAKNYGFKLITSSPRYSQSNGRVENAVKCVKKLMTKNDDPFLGLLAYRNSAIYPGGYSPAELLMGRRLRDTLPCLLEDRQVIDHEGFKVWCEQRLDKQISNYNERHSASNLKPLNPSDRVWIVDLKRYGVVKRESGEPRSYVVQTFSGEVRRNRKFLILAPNQTFSPSKKRQVIECQQNDAPQDVRVLVLESNLLTQPEEREEGDVTVLSNNDVEVLSDIEEEEENDLLESEESLDDYMSMTEGEDEIMPSSENVYTRSGRKVIPPKRLNL
ncbi:hypothetical protein M8J77_009432 [Diaphorina citri]|nr:hypothetical protein M8J77_009432 [Diaphorina citri]